VALKLLVFQPHLPTPQSLEEAMSEKTGARATLKRLLWLILCSTVLTPVSFSQSASPTVLRSAARALTTADVSGLAIEASEGDSSAQIMMGLTLQLYAERLTYDREERINLYKSSAYWFRRAAEKDSAPVLHLLALADLKISQCDEAVKSLNKAISQNYAPSMTALGQLYVDGGCVKPDFATGFDWLKKAAAGGDGEADSLIGDAYEQGRGVSADQAKSSEWFRQGAQIGDPASQNKLAIRLAEGIGTRKDTQKAVEWFKRSAEQGNYQAACNLALHYIRGEGVPKDFVTALMWGLIADVNASEIGCLSEIDTTQLLSMNSAQFAEATDRANAWLKEHHYPLTKVPDRHERP
jgi:TPR repeat protein